MAIELKKNYTANLDEVLVNASLTSDLLSDAETAQEGNQANEILVPKISMDGLGDIEANGNLADGEVALSYETMKFNYERGRKFQVKQITNEETADVVFGKLAAEFVRTKVVPEDDAVTFATLSANAANTETATFATGAEVIEAIRKAITKMDEAEVPTEQRFLYITPTLKGLIDDLDTSKSRAVLDKFEKIIEVPQSRFYTAIDLKDGKSSEEKVGHYAKDVAGKDINFMIVYKPAVMKFFKQVAGNIITPDENQNGYGYIQKYMKYGLIDIYENKQNGVFVHHKA